MDYSTLKKNIQNDISSDRQLNGIILKLRHKLKNETATYDDVTEFAKHLGNVTSKCLLKYGIPEEELGTYAEEIVAPIYRSMQKTSISASKMVQKLMNETNGIGLLPAEVATDESRLVHIINRFKEASSPKDVSFLVGGNVSQNIARGAVTDSIRANARLTSAAGLKSYVRREGNGCCAWCDSMTGIYEIGDEPDDFWRVHRDCTCSFDYKYEGHHSRVSFTTENGIMTKVTENL